MHHPWLGDRECDAASAAGQKPLQQATPQVEARRAVWVGGGGDSGGTFLGSGPGAAHIDEVLLALA